MTGAATAPAAPAAAGRRAPGGLSTALQAAVALALAAAALAIAWHGGVKGLGAFPDVLRSVAAALVLFGVAGYAPARLLVPRRMWTHFPWLVPLVGCAVAGMVLTALGFAALPLTASLVVVLVAGAGAGVAVRLRLGPARPDAAELADAGGRLLTLAWPAYLVALLMAIALVPILQQGFATMPGQNPDGLLGAGAARFLQEERPLGEEPALPIDKMPLVWRSKYPVYYVLAGVSSLSGLDTHEAFAALSVLLAALTAVAFMLLARFGLRAGPWAALAAMGLVAFDRALAHLAVHPYHNQLWGTLALPLIVLFGLRLIERPTRGDATLLALFLAIGLAAYPLMAVYPVVVLGAAAIVVRRAGGLRRPPALRLPRGRGSRLWLLPAALVAVPAVLVVGFGVVEKAGDAAEVVLGGKSLAPWAGDVTSFRSLGFFAGVPGALGLPVALALLGAAVLGLRRLPRPAAAGFGAAAAAAVVLALFFRAREFGEYFHFKALAFAAPLLLIVAAIWIVVRMGERGPERWAAAGLALIVALQLWGLGREVVRTGIQADRPVFDLAEGARQLPRGSTIRLDVPADGRQLWAAYALAEHPLSSTNPLRNTTFPHVPFGRKADYVVAYGPSPGRWPDSQGAPLFTTGPYRIYRLRSDVPGPDTSSRRAVDALSNSIG